MNAETKIKLPPVAIESEKTLLGSLLMNQSGLERISDIVRAESFYTKTNQDIFAAITHLNEREGVYDSVLVQEYLATVGSDADMNYLSELVDRTLGGENIENHAHQVRDAHMKRELLAAVLKVSEKIYDTEPLPADQAIDFAESMVLSVGESNSRRRSGLVHASASIQQTMYELEQRMKSGGGLVGQPTGFTELDKITGGLQRGDLIIVAGRPSMGKTTLAMNIAAKIGIRENEPVAVFSMEMGSTQLQQRLLSCGSQVPLTAIREGTLNESQLTRVTEASAKIANSQIHIDETGAMTPGEVRSRCRRLHKDTGGLGLVVIDYLQLMQTENREGNRNQQITEISQSLKSLAKELSVPVVCLSQLNRSVENRAITDRRPQMADLRESGAIEQDADVIAFVYRDEVYNEDSPWRGTAEILIRKQRQGATGMVRLAFNGPLTKFDNYVSTPADGLDL